MRSLPLLFIVAAAAEIMSIIWVGNLIGVLPTLLLMLLGGIVGVKLIKSAGLSVAAALRAPVQPSSPLTNLGGQAAAQSLSGILFLLPGFFSDLMGLMLFLPVVRSWLGSKFRVDTYTATQPSKDHRFGPVIEAEAVEITGEIEPPDRSLN
ncbi:MAG: FxsA family protein [Aestuariivirga sp.]|uniref:FxsA family protein n=1 Tax=Aestuariivirga sp. TaxID=2650926 RepID=UPI0030172BE4